MPTELIEAPGMKIQFLIEGGETNDSVSIFRCDFEAGARSPMPHSHDGFDETVVGLGGEFTMVVGGAVHTLREGDVIHVPRGVVHGFGVKGGGVDPCDLTPASSAPSTSGRWPTR